LENLKLIVDFETLGILFLMSVIVIGMWWQRVVQIEHTINEEGKLANAKVHQSSGKTILDKSALDASLQLQNEQLPKPKTTTTLILPVAFSLKGVA